MNETRRSLLVSSEWSTIAEHPVVELKEVFAVVGGQLRVLRGMGDGPGSFLKGWNSFEAAKAAFVRS